MKKEEAIRNAKNFGYQSWQFHKDQFNKYRFVEIK